jgi:hypothetical protein
MADLAWLDERLASDDEETEATWELLTAMHQQMCIINQTKALVHGDSPNNDCRFSEAHDRIWWDYFTADFVYPVETFNCRFRMRKELFARIHNVIVNYDVYF